MERFTDTKRRTNVVLCSKDSSAGRSNLDNLSHLFSITKRDCYQLRSNDNMLLLPKPNANAMKKSFGYRAAVTWNAQPLEDKIYGL